MISRLSGPIKNHLIPPVFYSNDMALEILLQLVILFLVIFDPLASLAVFLTASKSMSAKEKKSTARLAVLVASWLALAVIIAGEGIFVLFNTNLNEFRVAGGIILGLLGVRMVMGRPLAEIGQAKNNSTRAIAAIIGTPLLTGPAAMTAMLISVNDYGRGLTGLSVAIVLLLTAWTFYEAERIQRLLGVTGIQVISTFLGLVTLSWGVKFIVAGLKAILAG